MTSLQRIAAYCVVAGFGFVHSMVIAGAPRVLPSGQVPNDHRLDQLKDLKGYFPFEPPANRDQWEKRAGELRRRVLVATGLWPMPTKTPLNAVIHGMIDRRGFTVQKVYFESYPGHFVRVPSLHSMELSGFCIGSSGYGVFSG